MTGSGLFDGRSLSLRSREDGVPPWDWLPATFASFDQTMHAVDPVYPCHFGVRGQIAGNNWFAAVDERGIPAYRVADLARTLVTFRERAWSGPKRQSLVVFVGPPGHHAAHRRQPSDDLADDTARFWRLLAELSTYDADPWPPDMPADPHEATWQWCFAGEPWFTFMCSPAYRARASRNVGPCLTLVFQTRRVFDGLSGTSVAGTSAKEQVRQALLAYDSVPVHPHLGVTGSSSRYKWRQYALPDDQRELPADGCPWPAAARGPDPAAARGPDPAAARGPDPAAQPGSDPAGEPAPDAGGQR
jgi:FPC/CPF motif-containing protein YcgG